MSSIGKRPQRLRRDLKDVKALSTKTSFRPVSEIIGLAVTIGGIGAFCLLGLYSIVGNWVIFSLAMSFLILMAILAFDKRAEALDGRTLMREHLTRYETQSNPWRKQ